MGMVSKEHNRQIKLSQEFSGRLEKTLNRISDAEKLGYGIPIITQYEIEQAISSISETSDDLSSAVSDAEFNDNFNIAKRHLSRSLDDLNDTIIFKISRDLSNLLKKSENKAVEKTELAELFFQLSEIKELTMSARKRGSNSQVLLDDKIQNLIEKYEPIRMRVIESEKRASRFSALGISISAASIAAALFSMILGF